MTGVDIAFGGSAPSQLVVAAAGPSFDATWNDERSLRLLCCLRGNADHEYIADGRVQLHAIPPGTALLAPPGHPIRAGDAEATMANIIITPQVVLLRHRDRSRRIHPSLACIGSGARAMRSQGESILASLQAGFAYDLLLGAVGQLWHLAAACINDRAQSAQPAATDHFAAACQIIDEDLAADLGREQLARAIGVHPNHLSRLFRQQAGMGFARWLAERRLERATMLIREGVMNIGEAGHAVGFSSPSVFSQCCRRLRGCAPSQL